MSNLSDLLPTGGGQNAVDFVASGTLASGQAVVLKTDGTVEVISISAQSVGTPAVFNTASSNYNSAIFDSVAGKVVIAYTDAGNSNYGTAIVGTVSGTSITFGTEVIFESANTSYISATFDSTAGKVVITYDDNGNTSKGTAVVGTVSGTSISFGSPVIFSSGETSDVSATFDSASGKVAIAFSNVTNGVYGTAIVGTVSGTSISFGTAVVFNAAYTTSNSATFDSAAGKVVIAYRDGGNSNYGVAIVGTVSGTSITFGSEAVFATASTNYISTTFDSSSNKVVIAYAKNVAGVGDSGTAVVGTVSGTAISFGAEVVFNAPTTSNISATFDSIGGQIVIAYKEDAVTDYGTVIVGTVSGTTISFGSSVVFESAAVLFNSATFDTAAGKVVIAYRDIGNSNYGTGVVFAPPASNNTDFIGITAEAIADTATGPVNVFGGINEAQSGLTIAADYYVQADGSIATTVSDVKIGQAISATTINMMDLT
jgi:hypothetical protein